MCEHHTQSTDTTKVTHQQQLDQITRQLSEVLALLEGGRVVTGLITEADEGHSAPVAQLVGGVIGLIEQRLNRVYGEVEGMRG